MKKTLLAGGFAALLVAGGVALAVTNDPPAPSAERTMSVAKIQQRSAERFKRLDMNNDGTITWAEAEAARDKWRGGGDRADGDDHGDGGRHGHGRHGRGHGGGFGGGPGGRLAQLDTDGNGAVSLAEYNAGTSARLARLDADHDGKVTRDEFRAAREAFRNERGKSQ